MPTEARARARRQHGQAPPAPDRDQEGGIISKEAPIHLSNLAYRRSEGRQADPRRFQGSGRRPQGPLRQAFGRSDRWLSANARPTFAAARSTTTSVVRAEADRGVRLQEPDAGAEAIEKIVINMGVGEPSTTRRRSSRGEDLALIAGQKPVITKARKAIADLQAAREHADRLQGDAAQASACTSSSTVS
jgi:ribosomal protein L24